MDETADLQNLAVHDVLEAIGSARPSSGAGIAAALALAVGTACALKAVNVSLKHAEDEQLEQSGARLLAHRDRALELARIDAELYRRYLKEGETRDAAKLVRTAEDFQSLATDIAAELDAVRDRVRSSMAADVAAARLLHSAAVEIEALILRENRELRARTMP
jgi:formiminotetrahydrofolate cyclodeaminase